MVIAGNKYIDDTAPWTLAKDPAQRERLGTVMYTLLEAVRLIGLLVTPFMPDTGAKIATILGQSAAGPGDGAGCRRERPSPRPNRSSRELKQSDI